MSHTPSPQIREIPSAALLSNGRFHVAVTASGTGGSRRDWIALSRWPADPVEDAHGFFIYLQDLDSGAMWSVGAAPVGNVGPRYDVVRDGGIFSISHENHGIAANLEIAVARSFDAEVRRLRLRDISGKRRRIAATSYIEIALNHPAGDASHPAFSKLFVQTEAAPEQNLLLARRRPRADGERWPCMFHGIVGGTGVSWETDRLRFLGRGRGPDRPAALRLNAPLSRTTGNVLDPVFSLRAEIDIPQGIGVELGFFLGAADGRDAALDVAKRIPDVAAIRAALDEARATEGLLTNLAISDDGSLVPSTAPDGRALAIPCDRPVAPAPVAHPQGHPAPQDAAEALQFWNGYGGFSADGSEYVIRMPWADGGPMRPPLPWINVISNEHCGFLISESGAGHTWCRNSQANRLTPWSNDPVSDPHGEAIYIRDEADGAFWSPTPGPAPAPCDYEARHGFGYSTFTCDHRDLRHETTVFVPRHGTLKIARLRLTNRSSSPRHLSLFWYARLIMGSLPSPIPAIVTRRHDPDGTLTAINPAASDFRGGIAFSSAAVSGAKLLARHHSCDRLAFIGPGGSTARPMALLGTTPLDGATGAGLDPCFAHQLQISLGPGQATECIFLLGEAMSEAGAHDVAARHSDAAAIDSALEEATAFWRSFTSAIRVQTPSPAINLMLNGWLPYQNLSCRIWGRSAFYQSGGAYGFRDQLQDAAALAMTRPDITRAQILLHARHQFQEGDVLHWWHPAPMETGMRTRFSDDLLWLPFVTAHYIRTTGDDAILDELQPFVTAPPLLPDQDETYLRPEVGGESADLYGHCCRAIDRSLATGAHGLPLMGTGDWNDGMNRVGRQGRGESVWLGFFLHHVLENFLPLCERRGDSGRLATYRTHRDRLAEALNGPGWDGAWYRRAFYDDGTPLGSRDDDECRIDALAQAWAVISGVATPGRADSAMRSMERELVSEREGIIRLLAPPFANTPKDPGYIKGYVAGVRENGGQYTHAASWVIRAFAEHGQYARATDLLEMVMPVTRAKTREAADAYKTEPYVIAADVYGAPPHVGRGGWTWYTGSAGWMFRVAIESILGLHFENGDRLILRPRIPDHWPGFKIDCRTPQGATLHIDVENPAGRPRRIDAALFDGRPLPAELASRGIPLPIAGEHSIRIVLGGP